MYKGPCGGKYILHVGVLLPWDWFLECICPWLLHFLNGKLEQVGQLFNGQQGHGFALHLDVFCYCNLLTFGTKPAPSGSHVSLRHLV